MVTTCWSTWNYVPICLVLYLHQTIFTTKPCSSLPNLRNLSKCGGDFVRGSLAPKNFWLKVQEFKMLYVAEERLPSEGFLCKLQECWSESGCFHVMNVNSRGWISEAMVLQLNRLRISSNLPLQKARKLLPDKGASCYFNFWLWNVRSECVCPVG